MTPFTLLRAVLRTQEFLKVSSLSDTSYPNLAIKASTIGLIWNSAPTLMSTVEFSVSLIAMISLRLISQMKAVTLVAQKLSQTIHSPTHAKWSTWSRTLLIWLSTRTTTRLSWKVVAPTKTWRASSITTVKCYPSRSSGKTTVTTVARSSTALTTSWVTTVSKLKRLTLRTVEDSHSQCSSRNRSSLRSQSLLTAQACHSELRSITAQRTLNAEQKLTSTAESAPFIAVMISQKLGMSIT